MGPFETEFLYKHSNTLDWNRLSRIYAWPLVQIKEFSHLLNYNQLSRNKHLTEDVIEYLLDHLNLKEVQKNVFMSSSFIVKYREKLDLAKLLQYQKLSPETAHQLINTNQNLAQILASNPNLPLETYFWIINNFGQYSHIRETLLKISIPAQVIVRLFDEDITDEEVLLLLLHQKVPFKFIFVCFRRIQKPNVLDLTTINICNNININSYFPQIIKTVVWLAEHNRLDSIKALVANPALTSDSFSTALSLLSHKKDLLLSLITTYVSCHDEVPNDLDKYCSLFELSIMKWKNFAAAIQYSLTWKFYRLENKLPISAPEFLYKHCNLSVDDYAHLKSVL